jgi:hypothetical protein
MGVTVLTLCTAIVTPEIFFYKSTVANMATTGNCEVMSDTFYADKICT